MTVKKMNDIQKRLSVAIGDEKIKEVKSLLEEGSDPNGIDHLGWTPLMVAAESENIEIIKLLLAHGAEINKTDKNGQSPLHIAVDISIDCTIQSGGDQGDEPTETIMYLLENGASLQVKDLKGKTPLDWAREYRFEKIVNLLEAYLS